MPDMPMDFLPTETLDKASRILRANGWMPPIGMEWRTPHKPTRGQPMDLERKAIVRQFQEHPGEWARVEAGAKRSQDAQPWRRFRCEAVARRADDGKGWDIFARWPWGQPFEGEVIATSAGA